VRLTHERATLPLGAPFRISRSVNETVDVVWARLEGPDGVVGHGEAAPSAEYGESVESAAAFLDDAADLVGDDPFALEEIEHRLGRLPRQMAARAAVDAALHDLCGRLARQPVHRLLGVSAAGPPTSYTVWLGDPDDMARRAEAARDAFRFLKLKLGGGDGLDVDRVGAVRHAAGEGVVLRVDVNEWWSLDEALDAIPRLARLGVELVEQPLRRGDPDGPALKHASPLPVVVDEDCHTLADVAACADRAHGINIKLAKSGGIREGVRMAHAARALGLGVMLGCMVESGLGISAACQIASLCDHVDLDGNLLLAEDPWPGVELVDGVQLPPDAPGLGVHEAAPTR
jgi:L-alanine-DL-glutamate epimerase-like enolase superfamily enzyme